MMKNILVCVAHSDDETLGCGGTIAKHVKKGDRVFCIYMTDGVSARTNKKIEIQKRKKAAAKASKILGFKWLDNLSGNFPDNAFDSVQLIEIIKVIEKAKKYVDPHIIYTHSFSDLNIDHRILYQAVVTAFRPQPNEKWEEIITFEVPSATDYGQINGFGTFKPNLFINIKKEWKKKMYALKSYKSEIKKIPHTRSIAGIQTLARLRGMQNGMYMAEAFQIVKKIKR